MRTNGELHLTPDEIVERVFPLGDRPDAVPAHLATCSVCQARVARLREAWLTDRGAVAGVVDSIPDAFWEAERAAILGRLEEEEPEDTERNAGVTPFPSPAMRGAILRHPIVAAGSLAAAIVLVAGVTLSRLNAPAPAGRVAASATPAAVTVPAADHADDELLLSIDGILSQEPSFTSLVSEETL
jgi:anti-sigma factor RsiW